MFDLRLIRTDSLVQFSLKSGHPSLEEFEEDIIALLSQLCSKIHSEKSLLFKVSGFGLQDWGTDIATDLSIVLEQFPQYVSDLYSLDSMAILDFYEQGQERTLEFTIKDSKVKIDCSSYSVYWSPEPSIEIITIEQLEKINQSFISIFLDHVRERYPSFYSHEMFQEHFRAFLK